MQHRQPTSSIWALLRSQAASAEWRFASAFELGMVQEGRREQKPYTRDLVKQTLCDNELK